jgi:hypothetical protein
LCQTPPRARSTVLGADEAIEDVRLPGDGAIPIGKDLVVVAGEVVVEGMRFIRHARMVMVPDRSRLPGQLTPA